MWKMRRLASFAKQTPIPRTKIEPCPVTNAPPGRHRSQEVSNATGPHAKRAPLKKILMANAKTVHQVGYRKSWMPRNARDAHSAPPLCPIPVEVLRAVVVTLVRLAKPKVFVQNARRVSTKTPKAKQNAVKCVSPLEKYPTTNAPDVNCPRGVPAKWVNI